MSSISHLVLNEFYPEVIVSSEIQREPQHQIWIWSNEQSARYRADKLAFFFKSHCQPSFFIDSSLNMLKLIGSSKIPRETPHQIWIRSNQRLIRYRTHKLFGRSFFSNVLSVIFLLTHSSLKVNQIIRYNQRTTTSNLNVIEQTVHKISRPQAFWETIIFTKCPLSVILFLMDSSQKLIRSDIPREPQHQIWMWSIQRFIRYSVYIYLGHTNLFNCSNGNKNGNNRIEISIIVFLPLSPIYSFQSFKKFKTVSKISHEHKLFGRPFFSKCPLSVI